MSRRKAKLPYLAPWVMLPVAKGTCPECGRAHEAEHPHDQQSLTYQYRFYGMNGRWPTWRDAMAHCPDAVRKRWEEELMKLGQKLG